MNCSISMRLKCQDYGLLKEGLDEFLWKEVSCHLAILSQALRLCCSSFCGSFCALSKDNRVRVFLR